MKRLVEFPSESGEPIITALGMKVGSDAILVNKTVACVENPSLVHKVVRLGVETGRFACLASWGLVSPVANSSNSTRYVPAQSAS